MTADDVAGADAFFSRATDGSVLTLCLEVSLDAVKEAARAARERGARVVLNVSPYQKIGSDILDLVDILVVNAHELADLTEQERSSHWATGAACWSRRRRCSARAAPTSWWSRWAVRLGPWISPPARSPSRSRRRR